MKKVVFFLTIFSTFSCLAYSQNCNNLQYLVLSNNCSGGNWSAIIYIWNPDNSNGTWSSSDGSFTNEIYNEYTTYTIEFDETQSSTSLTITDDQYGCEETFEFVNPCNTICKEYDLCYELKSSDGCSATFIVQIQGDGFNFNDRASNLNFSFSTTSGIIENVSYYSMPNVLTDGYVIINNNTVYGGEDIPIYSAFGEDMFEITISLPEGSGENIEDCIELYCTPLMVLNGSPCFGTLDLCPNAEFCPQTHSIGGNIQAPSQFYDCVNTLNHGISNVEVSITGEHSSCSTMTDEKGDYECNLCDDGPYEVCVETTCNESCGLENDDLLLLRKYVLNIKAKTKLDYIIGDVNRSGSLTTIDIVKIQREILGRDQGINWCRFVPTVEYNSISDTPNSEEIDLLTNMDNCINVDDPSQDVNFYRFMMGDMNGSCSDCAQEVKGETPLQGTIQGNELTLVFNSNEVIYGFGLSLHNQEKIEINAIESTIENIQYGNNGNALNVNWVDTSDENIGYQLAGSQDFIKIIFNKPISFKDLDLSQCLILNEHGNISYIKMTK